MMLDAYVCIMSFNPYNGHITEMLLFTFLQMEKLRIILEISYLGFICT